jgi:hypothetical protein
MKLETVIRIITLLWALATLVWLAGVIGGRIDQKATIYVPWSFTAWALCAALYHWRQRRRRE